MLKPKKRKDRVYLMRSMKDGYVIRSNAKRVVLTKEATDGILLVYDPNYDYPCANRVVRLVLDMVYRSRQKLSMLNEFSWETFTPSMEKCRIPTDGVMGRELNWSELAAGWVEPKISDEAKASIAGLEIKGVELKQSKISKANIEELVAEFGNVAEQQLIERFVKDPTPSAEAVEQAQRIGSLMVHRWLEKQNC